MILEFENQIVIFQSIGHSAVVPVVRAVMTPHSIWLISLSILTLRNTLQFGHPLCNLQLSQIE